MIRLFTLTVLLALVGCLNTRNTNPIRVRRDPEVLAEREREQQLTFAEIREQQLAEREAYRLSPELSFSQRELEQGRERLREILARVPGDPWRSYELDRREIFYRNWRDIYADPPEIEPDTDGPPGWLGPRIEDPEPAAGPQPEDFPEEGEGDDGWDEGGDDWGDGGGDEGWDEGGDDWDEGGDEDW